MARVHAVVLAAGAASRMAVPKFALPAGPDDTLLSRVVALALAAVHGPVHVVTGRDADLAVAALASVRDTASAPRGRVAIVHNPSYAQGLSTSLRAGIAAADTHVDAAGVLVMLADQPGIDPTRLAALVETFAARSASMQAVAAACDGEQRNPVVLDRTLFAELLRLEGDQGARQTLRARPDAVVRVEWGRGPWTIDVDTWADYVALSRSTRWREESRPSRAADDSPGPTGALADAWMAIDAANGPPAERLAALRACVDRLMSVGLLAALVVSATRLAG